MAPESPRRAPGPEQTGAEDKGIDSEKNGASALSLGSRPRIHGDVPVKHGVPSATK